MAGTIKPLLIYDVTQTNAGAEEVLVVTRPFRVVDVHLVCTVSQVLGTITVQRTTVGGVTTALTDAMVCAVAGPPMVLTRALTLDATQWLFAVGESIRFTTANAAEGRVFTHILGQPIP